MSSNWEGMASVKKGNVGENIIRSYLEEQGYVVYHPSMKMPHPFDFMCYKDGEFFIADVKTKPCRDKYPDTGMDYEDYINYKRIGAEHNLGVFIFYVDPKLKIIYGNWLSELDKHTQVKTEHLVLKYPIIYGRVIFFPLVNMLKIKELSEEDCGRLDAISK